MYIVHKFNAVLNYKENFNQNNQKGLEYIVRHELRYFFLQLKNKVEKMNQYRINAEKHRLRFFLK